MGLFRKKKKEKSEHTSSTGEPNGASEAIRRAGAGSGGRASESTAAHAGDLGYTAATEDQTGVALKNDEAGQAETMARDRSLYRNLLDGLYDAVLILDEKGIIIGANARTAKLFGYSEADLWNTPCDQLIASLKPAVLYKVFQHAESGRFSVVNASCTRKDGTTFPAEIAMNLIDLLSKGNLLLSIRNIERRVLGQNRRSRDLALTDALATAVLSCRADGMILSVNPAFLRLSGLQNQQDAVHHFIGEFCESNEVGMQLLLKQQAAGAHWIGEMQFLGAGSRKVHVIATTARFKLDDTEQLAITFTPVPRRASVMPRAASSSQVG